MHCARCRHCARVPVRVVEKTASGVKIFLTEQDGAAGAKVAVGKVMSLFGKAKPKDEFQHVREYLPSTPGGGTSLDTVIEVMAGVRPRACGDGPLQSTRSHRTYTDVSLLVPTRVWSQRASTRRQH